MNLKTDYKDELLAAGEQYRKFNIVSESGEILYPNVHLEKAYTPEQEGDNFGALDINNTNKELNNNTNILNRIEEMLRTLSIEHGGTGGKTPEEAIKNLGILKRYEKTTTHTLTCTAKQYTKVASIQNLPEGWYLVTVDFYGWVSGAVSLAILSINSPSFSGNRTIRREDVWGGGGTALTGVQYVKEGNDLVFEVWVDKTDSIRNTDNVRMNAIRLY